MTLKQTIKNAISATMRSGYERFVTIDNTGDYSIHQTRHTIWDDQTIVGRTKILWKLGVMNVGYEAVTI
jgi:hypothetical protein